jgi:SAM-dependent methyltransferase
MNTPNTAVESMRDYYARRATYYERVYHKPERQADLRAMEAWLAQQFAGRHVLEIACGTGWWTPHGAAQCASWLATDVNPETMAIALTKKMPADKVQFATVDAYTLTALNSKKFDGAFAGCWWSHVPLQQLNAWLDVLHQHLLSGARVVMLDNSFVQASSSPVTRRDDDGNTYQDRVLDDGKVYEVLKNFPTREQAFAAVGARGTQCAWIQHDHYWILTYQAA